MATTGISVRDGSSSPVTPNTSASLCGECGMCCDGVLFHQVELQPGDHPRRLASFGLKLRRKKGVEFFLQPCSAHRATPTGCSCAIYEDRPARCRLFSCQQLLGVSSGAITEASALSKIREVRRLITTVHELMDQVGETNPNRGLAHRVANALTTKERTTLHDNLESSMKALEEILEKDFRVP
jgi:uncharacterized protein